MRGNASQGYNRATTIKIKNTVSSYFHNSCFHGGGLRLDMSFNIIYREKYCMLSNTCNRARDHMGSDASVFVTFFPIKIKLFHYIFG